MEREEFLTAINTIGTAEDDADRRSALADLSNNISGMFDDVKKAKETNDQLIAENEKLRSANMKLFLQVGEQKSSEDVKKNNTGLDQSKETKKSFESLFDEKGGLK